MYRLYYISWYRRHPLSTISMQCPQTQGHTSPPHTIITYTCPLYVLNFLYQGIPKHWRKSIAGMVLINPMLYTSHAHESWKWVYAHKSVYDHFSFCNDMIASVDTYCSCVLQSQYVLLIWLHSVDSCTVHQLLSHRSLSRLWRVHLSASVSFIHMWLSL